MDRRALLKGSAAFVVVAAGGGVWRAAERGVFTGSGDPAFEPWRNWRDDAADAPLAMVRAAILASNAVNCQPWLFSVSRNAIDVFVDPRRNLGAFDPFMRELHISIGCALENLLLAAAANGVRGDVSLAGGPLVPAHPPLMPARAAHVELAPGVRVASDLYEAIPLRHTNRAPFDRARPLPGGFADEVIRATRGDEQTAVFLFERDQDVARIAHLVADAGHAMEKRREIQAAVVPWLRPDWRAMTRSRDGLSVGNFGESPMQTALEKFVPLAILRAVTPRPTPAAYLDVMMTARLFGIIAVRDRYDRAANVRAGRIWQRIHLLATARGLAARPANQSVELIDHQRVWGAEPTEAARLAAVTRDAAWQPTFMFYVGYPTRSAAPTPRRDVHDVVI